MLGSSDRTLRNRVSTVSQKGGGFSDLHWRPGLSHVKPETLRAGLRGLGPNVLAAHPQPLITLCVALPLKETILVHPEGLAFFMGKYMEHRLFLRINRLFLGENTFFLVYVCVCVFFSMGK